MFEYVDDENFLLYAAHFYDNSACEDIKEFHGDIARIKYIKRLLKKYQQTGEIKERLVLNHLIILYNVFYTPAITSILCFKLKDHITILKTFLLYLNYWPEDKVDGVGSADNVIISSDISVDPTIVQLLREI